MRLRIGLALVLAALPALALEPPAELRLGAEQRIILTPPLAVESGDYRFHLAEVDRLRVAGEPLVRLLIRVTPRPGVRLPDDLAVLGEPLAIAADGRRLHPAELARGVRAADGFWLALTFDAPAGDQLPAIAATIGPRPAEQERVVPISPAPLGTVQPIPGLDRAVQLSVVRRETSALPTDDLPGPLESMLDSTRPTALEPPPASDDRPYLTLRLHLLEPEADDGWRLADLRLTGADGRVDQWRYLRRWWRPDWGGWLGATGRDEAPEGTIRLEAIAPSSPAEAAGLRVGDRVLGVDGEPPASAFDLGERVRRGTPGTPLRLDILRDGRRLALTIPLGEKPLWPDRDPREFGESWAALSAALGGGPRRVLSQWDWQSWAPVTGTMEPTNLDLVFRRLDPSRGTIFVFTEIPIAARA